MNPSNVISKHIVLLVDDELLVRWSLSKILSKQGFEVYTAATANEALVILEQEEVDWLVTDLKMPGMDGLELIKRLRERYPAVKLVLMSAYGSPTVAKEAKELGAMFMNKPFDADALIDALSEKDEE